MLQLILGHAGRLAAVGTACGVVAAGLATGLLEGMLYGVRPLDPPLPAARSCSARLRVASLIPAWRAASVNPVDALGAVGNSGYLGRPFNPCGPARGRLAQALMIQPLDDGQSVLAATVRKLGRWNGPNGLFSGKVEISDGH